VRFLIVILALAACAPCPSQGAGPVTHVGAPPPGADVVVAVARERCAFSGTVTWQAGLFVCDYSGIPYCSGWQRAYPACAPLDAWVAYAEPVTRSALAWEVGNYCLDNEDGPRVAEWSEAVNAEASRRMAP